MLSPQEGDFHGLDDSDDDDEDGGKYVLHVRTALLEVKKGAIKKITADQLFINIQSLCIFPFLAKPMIKGLMQFDDKAYMAMIERRKKEVAQFIIDAIKL